jgi:hypothetical protein
MTEKKSKYLVWLETLHREYTERTCITQLGRQAASLHLLAGIYEVRCRFERIHERLQGEAMLLEDKGLNYEEWYNPEKWKRGESLFVDEDIRETFGFKPSSPLAQTYANSLLTPFGDNATFNVDNFRDVVSTLFIFDQVVDSQKMEVAIDEELKKLLTVLLNISNLKNTPKTDEENAEYFKKERIRYRTGFLTKASLKAKHKKWKDSISEDMNIDVLHERRVELLLAIFDSGFLDDLKKENHRRATDVLSIKEYEFDKWDDRMDEAVKYFAAMSKLCPFRDDMIDFSQDAKLGRYVISHHIELPMVNAFLENMELIKMVQREMQKLDNPDMEDADEGDSPAESFVERVKHIMLKAEEDNGTTKNLTARGNGGTYIYNVDGKGFSKVMDELLACHEQVIKDYLDGANVETAASIKYVAPFIGYVLDTHLYSAAKMPKNAFKEVFEVVYGKGTSATLKMSDKNPSNEATILYETAKEIMEKHKNG